MEKNYTSYNDISGVLIADLEDPNDILNYLKKNKVDVENNKPFKLVFQGTVDGNKNLQSVTVFCEKEKTFEFKSTLWDILILFKRIQLEINIKK